MCHKATHEHSGAEKPTALAAEHAAALVTLRLLRECRGTKENAGTVLMADTLRTVDMVNFVARETANCKLTSQIRYQSAEIRRDRLF